jgi:hypothetical protein
MPDNEGKAEGRARWARQSKREVARSQQIMKESEVADDKADQDRVLVRDLDVASLRDLVALEARALFAGGDSAATRRARHAANDEGASRRSPRHEHRHV